MSRHRNVRSMNYSDEYDGYDDVYGHSVEDEYCISPSDEAQFMYDRTRQPQISAFFSEQDNITEEDENVDQSNDRKNSESYMRPTLSDLNEAKLRSCLEEIRNVIGDSISERVLVETVLKCDFNVNKSLDTILSNATSSSEPISDAPKSQRVRRDRDRDFVNFHSNLLCLVSHTDVKHLSENFNVIKLQGTEQNPCQDVLFCNEGVQNGVEDVCNKFNMKLCNATSCNVVPEQNEGHQHSRVTSSNLNTDCSSSVTCCNIPCSFSLCCEVNSTNAVQKKSSKVKIENSVQIVDTNNILRKSDSSLGTRMVKCKGSPSKTMSELKNLSSNAEGRADPLMDDCSSDEACGSSPLAMLSKQFSSAADRYQGLRRQGDANEIKDQCEAFQSLTIRESHMPPSRFAGKNKGALQQEGDSSHDTDNSEDEKSVFSSLADLASRHRKHKNTENYSSDENEQQPISTFLSVAMKYNSSSADGQGLSEAELVCRDKGKLFTSNVCKIESVLLNKSYDEEEEEEENTFSPLAALADKYNKGKAESFNSASSVTVPANSARETPKAAKTLCKCKSESDGYPSSSPSHGTTNRRNKCGLSCKVDYLANIDAVRDHAMFEDIDISRSKDQESFLTQNKPATSLSDLAVFHLTRSASCSMKSDCNLTNKKFHSDSGISKSVPGGFVIPFLKQEEGIQNGVLRKCEKSEVESDVSMDSTDDEWVIDLSSAIRDPGLRLLGTVTEDKLPAKLIDVRSTEEVQENTVKIAVAPCELDARGMLKMKFSCTKRRCSPFGSVLCHQWRELVRPYIPPTQQYTRHAKHYAFNEDSPDDKILVHLKKRN